MRHLVFVVAFALVGFEASVALAQGTAAQREACSPDAIRLCSDTIPDVARTTACMKIRASELSPECRAIVLAAVSAHPPAAQSAVAKRAALPKLPASNRRTEADQPRPDPDAEVAYVPPRRVIEPPVYEQPGRVIFPAQPYADGTFCSPPYDFCEPNYVDPNDPE